jgi:lysophospholipase L1-like esterase
MNLFDEEVRALEIKARQSLPGGTVFYGSSSIRLWNTLEVDFGPLNPVNLGFGGATLAACAWHFERIVLPARPRALVIYAGDNDLGEGRQPEEVCLFFNALSEKIQQHLPGVSVTFLSIKPSPSRWNIVSSIRLANTFIAEAIGSRSGFQFVDATAAMLTPDGKPDMSLYEADGLHLSLTGYERWHRQLAERLEV